MVHRHVRRQPPRRRPLHSWLVRVPTTRKSHTMPKFGAMPTWVGEKHCNKEPAKKANIVASLVTAMHEHLSDRLDAHRKKAAKATRWIEEREERRGLMRSVLVAWAGVRGSQAVPNAHLSREQWKEWRDKEKPAERNDRRLREAVDRITSFARCCFNKFWAEREKKKRTLCVRLAVLRKARNVAALILTKALATPSLK